MVLQLLGEVVREREREEDVNSGSDSEKEEDFISYSGGYGF